MTEGGTTPISDCDCNCEAGSIVANGAMMTSVASSQNFAAAVAIGYRRTPTFSADRAAPVPPQCRLKLATMVIIAELAMVLPASQLETLFIQRR